MKRSAIILFILGCGAETPLPESNDMSFLIPLASDMALGATSEGGHGVVLPREVFDILEAPTRVDEPDDLYANLKVVGVRLDPCFTEGAAPMACSPQVRLVFQPVFDDGAGATTRDATIHAFYPMPLSEVAELAEELRALRAQSGGAPAVGVVADPVQASLLVMARVGAERLTRVTFIAVHASDEAWTLGGFDLLDGVATRIEVPGGDELEEQHMTSTGGTTGLSATILPEPEVETDVTAYLDAERRPSVSAEERASAIFAFERLLDPAEHNPGTVDCASCHVATTGLRFATRESAPERVSAAYDDTRNQRMFGWFGAIQSISPRVLAETQIALETLRAGLLPD
jgi:hypothetical protein